jgi:hypothetical protein
MESEMWSRLTEGPSECELIGVPFVPADEEVGLQTEETPLRQFRDQHSELNGGDSS